MTRESLALAAVLAFLATPALACQSWEIGCQPPASPARRVEEPSGYGGRYQPSRPYASPGTPLLSEPVYEPWRQPGAGDPLLSNPQQRRGPEQRGRSLLYGN